MQIAKDLEKINRSSDKKTIDKHRNLITNVIANSRGGMPTLLKHEFFDGKLVNVLIDK